MGRPIGLKFAENLHHFNYFPRFNLLVRLKQIKEEKHKRGEREWVMTKLVPTSTTKHPASFSWRVLVCCTCGEVFTGGVHCHARSINIQHPRRNGTANYLHTSRHTLNTHSSQDEIRTKNCRCWGNPPPGSCHEFFYRSAYRSFPLIANHFIQRFLRSPTPLLLDYGYKDCPFFLVCLICENSGPICLFNSAENFCVCMKALWQHKFCKPSIVFYRWNCHNQ
jgi:hypothetical protein